MIINSKKSTLTIVLTLIACLFLFNGQVNAQSLLNRQSINISSAAGIEAFKPRFQKGRECLARVTGIGVFMEANESEAPTGEFYLYLINEQPDQVNDHPGQFDNPYEPVRFSVTNADQVNKIAPMGRTPLATPVRFSGIVSGEQYDAYVPGYYQHLQLEVTEIKTVENDPFFKEKFYTFTGAIDSFPRTQSNGQPVLIKNETNQTLQVEFFSTRMTVGGATTIPGLIKKPIYGTADILSQLTRNDWVTLILRKDTVVDSNNVADKPPVMVIPDLERRRFVKFAAEDQRRATKAIRAAQRAIQTTEYENARSSLFEATRMYFLSTSQWKEIEETVNQMPVAERPPFLGFLRETINRGPIYHEGWDLEFWNGLQSPTEFVITGLPSLVPLSFFTTPNHAMGAWLEQHGNSFPKTDSYKTNRSRYEDLGKLAEFILRVDEETRNFFSAALANLAFSRLKYELRISPVSEAREPNDVEVFRWLSVGLQPGVFNAQQVEEFATIVVEFISSGRLAEQYLHKLFNVFAHLFYEYLDTHKLTPKNLGPDGSFLYQVALNWLREVNDNPDQELRDFVRARKK